MKERTWVYTKILFLILSINLFLCTDIVECTERMFSVVNPILGENKIPILNFMHEADNKYYNDVVFGEMSATEKKEDYIEKFLRYMRDKKKAVFLEIIFTMDKSWENTDLFKKMKSTDEAIIFKDLRWFWREYGNTFINIFGPESAEKLLEHITEPYDTKVVINNDEKTKKDRTKKRYYVITSAEKLQMIVNIIEKGISKFMTNYEYISYYFNILHPQESVDVNAFENDFNRKGSILYDKKNLIGRK